MEKSRQNLTAAHVTSLIPVVQSINTTENYRGFAFRAHTYATSKELPILLRSKHDFFLDMSTSMSRMDRACIAHHVLHIFKHRTSLSSEIRGIESKVHDSSKYVLLDPFFQGELLEGTAMAHVKGEFHLIDDHKVKLLIERDVLGPEQIVLKLSDKAMEKTIEVVNPDNTEYSLNFWKTMGELT